MDSEFALAHDHAFGLDIIELNSRERDSDAGLLLVEKVVRLHFLIAGAKEQRTESSNGCDS